MKKTAISLILCISAILSCAVFAVPASAETDSTEAAENITSEAEFYCWGQSDYSALTDGDAVNHFSIGYAGQLVINSETPIAGLYVKFYLESAVWEMTVNDKKFNRGEDDFLHEYVDIAALAGETTQIIMDFPRSAKIGEIEIYTSGKLPDDVQVWEKPLERADLVLFSSHSDDEQLFFAGVLPYSVAYGARTQVVYFCDHSDTPVRPHEQLNGLWAVGIRNYPVIGAFPDLYSESKEGGEQVFANAGYGHEDFIEWQVENLRRFKPQVAIAHDAAGEYGHGTHIINSETLREAVAIAADPEQYPYLTASYGVWDTPKVYLHLWAENEIVMDFDVPLDCFGGKSAYEMSRIGYGYHNSQHWTWFTDWLIGTEGAPITKAAQIGQYSPCRYGLWRSTVGADTKADFFDNITLYSVQEEEEARATDTEGATGTAAPAAPQTDMAGNEGGGEEDSPVSPLMIAALVGGVAMIVLIVVLVRRSGKSCPPEPTRAQSQAEKLKAARERSRAEGNAPSRSDIQAQRLREARERAAGSAGSARPTGSAGGSERSVRAVPPSNAARPANGEARPAQARPATRPVAKSAGSKGEGARPAQTRSVNGAAQQRGQVRPAEKKADAKSSPVSHTKPTDKTY